MLNLHVLPGPEGLPSSEYSSATEIGEESPAADCPQSLEDLIFNVASTFISQGGPSHRIQPVIEALGKAFNRQITVISMSTYTVLSFLPASKRGPPAIYHIDERGSMNFTRLPHVFALVKDMIRRPEDFHLNIVYAELERIKVMKSAWSEYAIAASYVPAAATSAIMFFGGDWGDAAMSGALAVIPALLRLVTNKWEKLWV